MEILMTKTVVRSMFFLVLFYTVSIALLVWLSSGEYSLPDTIAACKIASLAYLVVTNHELAIGSRHKPACARINFFILSVVLVILMVSIADLSGASALLNEWSHSAQGILLLIVNNSTYLSAFPFLAFFFLDLYILKSKDSDNIDQKIASDFIVYSDIVCLVPLILMSALIGWYSWQNGDATSEIKTFFSGMVAILLLASALTASILEAFHRREFGKRKKTGG